MKKIILLIIVLVNANTNAQWFSDSSLNNLICNAAINYSLYKSVSDGSGGAIIVWSDGRNGTSDIYAQRINANGVLQWTINGVAICNATGEQVSATIIPDGNGGAIITWLDTRNGNNDIYAQRINSSGASQWTTNGVAISTAINQQGSPRIVTDGSGGAIISWLDDKSYTNGAGWNVSAYENYVQRINGNGVVQWTVNGKSICSEPSQRQSAAFMISDGSTGAILTWKDRRNGNDDIYSQRVNSSGVTQWTTNGVAICTQTSGQSNPAMVLDGNGGAIITWDDNRDGGVWAFGSIYAQRVNSSGTVQWTADGVQISNSFNGTYSSDLRYPAIVSDGDSGAIIVFAGYQQSYAGATIAQRINSSGVVQWTTNGISLTNIATSPTQDPPQVISDGNGAFIVAWGKIFAQKINLNGALQWNPSGVIVASENSDKFQLSMVPTTNGGAIFSWEEYIGPVTGYYINAKRILSNGNFCSNPPTVTANTTSATVCSGETITLTGGGTDSYTWSNGVTDGVAFIPPVGTTIYAVTGTTSAADCKNTATMTISVSPNTNPTFMAVAPICAGGTLFPLQTTSTNNITGTWSPALNNTATTTYTFTPSPGQCATTKTMTIVVNPIVSLGQTFTQVNAICSGATLSALPNTSNNGITGTWSPALNNTITTNYTFTPTTSQCATTSTMTITVNQKATPIFTQVSAICPGATLAALLTTSTNGITGTWSPALNNTATTTYTFTPTIGQCANTKTMTITVNPNVTPVFSQIAPICSGANLGALPTTSTNGIFGTWSPAMNNTATTTYTFTPTTGQCATAKTMTITVNQNVTPIFSQVAPICSGATLSNLATTSTNAVTGTWSPPINNSATTMYTFIPTIGLCANTATMNIIVNPKVTPAFSQVAPICSGATLADLPTTSTNAVIGTWSPPINNSVTTSYTFTPSTGLCANTTTMTITVNPNLLPTFTQVSAICSGAPLGVLPTTSTNGISGIWSPAIDNTATTTYTFVPIAGLCAHTANMTITVNPRIAPTFTQVNAICSGATLTALPTTSINEITGTWFPTMNNTATTTYTFTPAGGLCAHTETMTITVNPNLTPTFTQVSAICSGAPLGVLPTTSTNAITGTWSPVIDNTATTTYTFTPIAGLCANTTTMTITVITTAVPTASDQTFCTGTTVSSLVANGIDVKWYPTNIGETAFDPTTPLATGTYFVSQTLNSCESLSRTSVFITVNVTPAPIASAQTFNSTSTVANLDASGTDLKWYTEATGGSSLTTSTPLNTSTYYVSQTLNGCESERTSVSVINILSQPSLTTSAPDANTITSNSVTMGGNLTLDGNAPIIHKGVVYNTTGNPTTADNVVNVPGFNRISNFTASIATGPFSVSLSGLNSATTFYAKAYASNSFGVTYGQEIAFTTLPSDPPSDPQTFCFQATVANLEASGTDLKWYDAATNSTPLTNATFLASGTYYVSQTINGIESNRTAVVITLTPQPVQPTLACYESATFNTTSCNWDVTGSQPAQPTLACYESATFNTTSCNWDVTGSQPAQPTLACYESATFNTTNCTWDITGTQPAQPTLACYESATFNTTSCNWDITGTQPTQPTLACYESATFNTTNCTWDITGTQPVQPTLACYESATFNTTNCTWDITGTQPAQPTLACYESAAFNAASCNWDITGTQPVQPTLACYESATFNTTNCNWDVTGTQPVQPTLACYESATFNTTNCNWYITGTQPAQPTLACYESATFNTASCNWDITGTQPAQPTLACYESATFNTTSCNWDVTGSQPAQPTLACYESATFNTTNCNWDITGTQPAQPTLACYESATFNTTNCIWDITGTQPTQPTLACYESATFNTTSCNWDITGTQPAQPTLACYESATFNTTNCTWDITGTQPVQPTLACYESATFNTTNCTWDITGTQPAQPTLACYESAAFNAASCNWDITGTQPVQPTLACYESATFNTTSCNWDVTGTQPTQPTLACYESATFNTTSCNWDITGTQPTQPTLACYESATFNTTSCNWDVTGTQPTQPTLACYESATFNTTSCNWDITGTQPAQPTLACYQSATFNAASCNWDVTGTQPTQPTLSCYESATFNTTNCNWDVTGTQPAQPTMACYESAIFNTTSCAWDVTGTQPAQPTLACYESATFNTTNCTWDITGTQPAQPTLACYESAAFNATSCNWDVTGMQPAQPTLACYESATFNATSCNWDITGSQPAQPTLACYESAAFNTNSCAWDIAGIAPTAPSGEAAQTFSVVALTDATIANLVVSPLNVIWYANIIDAQSASNPLESTSVLTDGANYYAVNMENGCASSPFAVTVSVTLGNPSFKAFSLQLYPIPVKTILFIQPSNNITINKIIITDLTGKIVLIQTTSTTQVNVNQLASGVYILEAFSGEAKFITKFIKN